jgi:hypothetical protein
MNTWDTKGTRRKFLQVLTFVSVVSLALMLVDVHVFAQRDRTWHDPYDRGVKAFDAGRYQDAVNEIERAVKMDARSGANKFYEGVYSADYFPYVYLGMAYSRLNDFGKAKENFDKAQKEKMPTRYVTLTTNGLTDLNSRMLASAKPAPTTPAPTTTTAAATPTPSVPARNPAFDSGLKQLEGLLAARNYDGALKTFDNLRNLDAAEYGREKLQARRDDTATQYARQIADDAGQLLKEGKLGEAKARYTEADRVAPGQRFVQDGLASVEAQLAAASKPPTPATTTASAPVSAPVAPPSPSAPMPTTARIADASLRQFESGRKFASGGNYRGAETAYAAAVAADKNNREASAALENIRRFSTLVNESRSVSKRGDIGGAMQRLQDAKALDSIRFEFEKLSAELDTLVARMAGDSEGKALREALLALLRGDAKASSDMLEPLVAKPGNPKSSRLADLQAYLGVAYATRSLTATRDDEKKQLEAKAMEYFRQAVTARKDYQLSTRLVSPRIVDMFAKAR